MARGANASGGYIAPLTIPESNLRRLADILSDNAYNNPIQTGGWGGLAQLGGNLAQVAASKYNADKADKERSRYVSDLTAKFGQNVPQQYQPLVEALANNGDYGGLYQIATDAEARRDREKSDAFVTDFLTGGRTQGGAAPQPGGPVESANPAPTNQETFDMSPVPPQYRKTVDDAARKYGLPPEAFAAQLYAESRFDPNAVSKAGARGIAQWMPDSAADPGFGMGSIDPADPAESIWGAAEYMSNLNKRYGGDWNNTLAAYNQGMGNVDRGAPRPPETESYVAGLAPQFAGGGQPPAAPASYRPPANYQSLLTQTDIAQIMAAPTGEKRGLLFDIIQKREAEANKAPETSGGMQYVNGRWVPLPQGPDDPPSGYRFAQGGALEAIPGGPADPATKAREAPAGYMFDDGGGLKPIPGGQFDPRNIDNIQKLEKSWRDEFKKPIEQASDLTTQIGTIRNAVSRGDGTGDIAAITSFNKLLDPGAVVREADVALTLQAQGLADQLQVWMKNKQEGDVLPPELRQRMLALSEQIYTSSNGVLKNRILPYAEVIEGQGGKFSNVIPPRLQKALGWTTQAEPGPKSRRADPAKANSLLERFGVTVSP